jgi:hypothetical protein
VPHRHLFGIGKPRTVQCRPFDRASDPRRGSWDLLPDGTCCTPKKWLTLEAGTFHQAKGMLTSFFESRRKAAPTTSNWDVEKKIRQLRSRIA